MDQLERIVELQHALQVESFGVDPLTLQGEERVEFIRWNVLALQDELHELLQEVGWKPWASSRHVNEHEAFGELIDALHFLVNLLLTVAPRHTPAAEVARAVFDGYDGKRRVNAARQAEGYDGVSGKCPACSRDRHTTERVEGELRFCPCGFEYTEVPA